MGIVFNGYCELLEPLIFEKSYLLYAYLNLLSIKNSIR